MTNKFSLKLLFTWGMVLCLGLGSLFLSIARAQESGRDREEIFRECQETMQRAEEEGLPLLSPNNFAAANEIYQKALQNYERGESTETIRENCRQAVEFLNAGFEVAQNSRMVLERLLDMREQTLELTAITLLPGRADSKYFKGRLLTESDFRDEQSYNIPQAESKFREAAVSVEAGDLETARALANEAMIEYRSAALEVMKINILGEARERLNNIEAVSGESLRLAFSELDKLERFIASQRAREFSIGELSSELHHRIEGVLTFAGVEKQPMRPPSESSRELQVEALIALRDEAMELAASAPDRELLDAADELFNRSVEQAERGRRIVDQRGAQEAEARFREAILSSLREGPLQEARMKLEEMRADLTPEEFERKAQNLEKAQEYIEQAYEPGIYAADFLDRIQKVKDWVFLMPKPLPDLTVELWSVPESQKKLAHLKWLEPYPPIKDQLTTVSVVVKNVGKAPVDKSFDTELWVDGKLVKTWTFSPFLKEENMQDPLSTGETLIRDYTAKFSAGKHTFLWKVDSKNQVTESDETKTSNELTASDIWKATTDLPDLIVEDIYHDGALLIGNQTTWKIKIKNSGKMDITTPFMTSLKSGAVQIGAFWLNSLKAGDSKTFDSKQPTAIIASKYTYKDTLTGVVDVSNVIPELNENNNKKVRKFTISYVDLEVSELMVTPKQPVVHEPVTFSFTIKNNGPGDATMPFKIRVMPGKVSTKGTTEPIILTFPKDKLPLKPGKSVKLQHKVTLAYAGSYQAGVIADYSDPKGVHKKVYTEKKSDNNTRTYNFSLKQTYYVKISKIEYTDCNDGVIVHLDRSGGFWKGDVKLQLMSGSNVVKFARPYNKKEVMIASNKNKSEEIIPSSSYLGYNLKLKVYAVEAGKSIASSAPEKTLQFPTTDQLSIDSVSPSSGARGAKVKVTISGKAFSSAYSSYPPSVSAKSKKCTECPNYDGISIKVNSYTYDKIQAELDIKANASTGKKWIHVYANCNGADAIPFSIIDSTPKAPTTKEFTLYLKKQPGPLKGGKIPFAGSILPIPNGVLQTIKNVNTSMGNRWGVRIIKAGYTTNDCDKSKAVIDLAPGKSTSDFKGTSLSKGLPVVACIYAVQANVVPNMVALKITYTK